MTLVQLGQVDNGTASQDDNGTARPLQRAKRRILQVGKVDDGTASQEGQGTYRLDNNVQLR